MSQREVVISGSLVDFLGLPGCGSLSPCRKHAQSNCDERRDLELFHGDEKGRVAADLCSDYIARVGKSGSGLCKLDDGRCPGLQKCRAARRFLDAVALVSD